MTGATPPGAQVPVNPSTGMASGTEPAGAPPDSQAVSLRQRVGAQVGSMARYLFPFLHSTIAAFAGLLLIIFMAIYIAADPELYHRGLISMFPKRHRRRVGEVFSAR